MAQVTDAELSARSLLKPEELRLIREVFRRHPEVDTAILYGSRAKGTAHRSSDLDLALQVSGTAEFGLVAKIWADLDDLPLPYKFDIQILGDIASPELRSHIARVGLPVFERGRTGSPAHEEAVG